MKNSAIAASAGIILIGAYSFVYACNATKAQSADAKAPKAQQEAVWYSVDNAGTVSKHTIDTKVVCKTVQSVAPITIDVDVPSEAFHMSRVIHISGHAVKHQDAEMTPVDTVRKTAKMAATLGRALVTTVGAVFGTLFDAAVEATASLV